MNQGPSADPVDRSRLPWIAVALTLALLAGASVVAVRDWSFRPTGRVAALVPPDGHRVVDRRSGSMRVVENATVVGDPGLALIADPLVRQLRELGQGGPGPFQLWWRSAVITGPDSTLTRLLVVRRDALRLQLVDSGGSSVVYAPGLLLLPSSPSETWQQDGEAVDGTGLRRPYALSGRIVPTDDRAYADRECRSIRLTLTVGGARPEVERYVLCPGAGLVDVLTGDERRDGTGDVGPPPVPGPPPTRPPADPASWTASTYQTATALSARELAMTAGDRLVGAVHDESDLIGWRRSVGPDGGQHWGRAWLRRPGGRILTVRTAGRTVLVTTDQRTVVAYDESGRWLWSQPTPDISRAGATPLPGDRFVVGLLDGRVQLRRTADGTLLAEDRLPGGVLARAAATSTGGFYVADDSGTLRAYGEDGVLDWEQRVPVGRVWLLATADGVVIRTVGRLGLLVDGTWVWRLSSDLGPPVLAGDLLVAGKPTELLALRVADGGVAWRRPDLSPALVAVVNPVAVVGDRVVLVDEDRLLLLDRSGGEVAQHPLPDTSGLQIDVTPADGSRGVTVWSSLRADVTVWGPGADA